jgi:hypothetical protein
MSVGLSVYPLSLLVNNWVKAFLRQGRNFGGVVINAVHVVSRISRRIILPTNHYLLQS